MDSTLHQNPPRSSPGLTRHPGDPATADPGARAEACRQAERAAEV